MGRYYTQEIQNQEGVIPCEVYDDQRKCFPPRVDIPNHPSYTFRDGNIVRTIYMSESPYFISSPYRLVAQLEKPPFGTIFVDVTDSDEYDTFYQQYECGRVISMKLFLVPKDVAERFRL